MHHRCSRTQKYVGTFSEARNSERPMILGKCDLVVFRSQNEQVSHRVFASVTGFDSMRLSFRGAESIPLRVNLLR